MEDQRKSFISSLVSLFYWKENYSPFFIIMLVFLTPLFFGMMGGNDVIAIPGFWIFKVDLHKYILASCFYILESCFFGIGTGGFIFFLIRKRYYTSKKKLFILTVLCSSFIYFVYNYIWDIYWKFILVILHKLFLSPEIFLPSSHQATWDLGVLFSRFGFYIIMTILLSGSLYLIAKNNYKKVFIFLTVLALTYRSFFCFLSYIQEDKLEYITIINMCYPFLIGTGGIIYTVIKERYKNTKTLISFTILYTFFACLFLFSALYLVYFRFNLLYGTFFKEDLIYFMCRFLDGFDNDYLRNIILIIRYLIVALTALFSIMSACPWLRPEKVRDLSEKTKIPDLI